MRSREPGYALSFNFNLYAVYGYKISINIRKQSEKYDSLKRIFIFDQSMNNIVINRLTVERLEEPFSNFRSHALLHNQSSEKYFYKQIEIKFLVFLFVTKNELLKNVDILINFSIILIIFIRT